jgi:hypothetical protein
MVSRAGVCLQVPEVMPEVMIRGAVDAAVPRDRVPVLTVGPVTSGISVRGGRVGANTRRNRLRRLR